MASPAPPGRQAGRWTVAPERMLAWLSLLGLACYGALWFVHQTFYSVFGVSLAMVGVGQAQMVTAAAVAALLSALLLAYLAIIVRFSFPPGSMVPWRVAVLEAIPGVVLMGGALLLLAPLGQALRGANGGTSGILVLAFFVMLAALLGAVLFARGVVNLLHRWLLRRLYQVRKWLLVRRYLGRDASAEAVIATYLPARRAARRRVATRRAARRRTAWRRDLRVVSRMYRLALAAMLGLAFFMAVFALAFTADEEARARIAGRTYETTLLYDILTPGTVARPVEVIAQDPRLRSFEKAQLLYLGTHDGMQVLYDRTKQHAVLVPAGSVTLILS